MTDWEGMRGAEEEGTPRVGLHPVSEIHDCRTATALRQHSVRSGPDSGVRAAPDGSGRLLVGPSFNNPADCYSHSSSSFCLLQNQIKDLEEVV